MGSGKSFTGRRMAEAQGRAFIDLDDLIEAHTGQSIPQIFETKGEDGFRAIERECLHSLAGLKDAIIVATGGGTPCFFDNMEWMNSQGSTIWLDVPVATLVERLWPERAKRPLLAHIPETEFAAFIEARLAARQQWYARAKRIMQPDEDIQQQS